MLGSLEPTQFGHVVLCRISVMEFGGKMSPFLYEFSILILKFQFNKLVYLFFIEC